MTEVCLVHYLGARRWYLWQESKAGKEHDLSNQIGKSSPNKSSHSLPALTSQVTVNHPRHTTALLKARHLSAEHFSSKMLNADTENVHGCLCLPTESFFTDDLGVQRGVSFLVQEPYCTTPLGSFYSMNELLSFVLLLSFMALLTHATEKYPFAPNTSSECSRRVLEPGDTVH